MYRISYRQSLGTLLLSLLLTMGLGIGRGYAQSPTDTPTVNPNEIAEPGVLIVSTLPDTPAAAANIARGDIILKIDDEKVDDALALTERIQNAEPGDTLEITLLHGDEERTVEVTLGEKDDVAYLGVRPYIDVTTVTIDEIEADIYGQQPQFHLMQPHASTDVIIEEVSEVVAGATVVTVAEGTPAQDAGLQPGDVIVAIDGETVTDAETLVERVGSYAPGDEITLKVIPSHTDATNEEDGDAQADSTTTETVEEDGIETDSTVVESTAIEPETTEITLVLAAHPEDEEKPYLGVQVLSERHDVTIEMVPPPYMPYMMLPTIPGYPIPRGGYAYPLPDYGKNGPRSYRFWIQPMDPGMEHGQRHKYRFIPHPRQHDYQNHFEWYQNEEEGTDYIGFYIMPGAEWHEQEYSPHLYSFSPDIVPFSLPYATDVAPYVLALPDSTKSESFDHSSRLFQWMPESNEELDAMPEHETVLSQGLEI